MTNEEKLRRKRASDLEQLQELQDRMIEELRSKEMNPKVGDLLKTLELKLKLKLPADEKAKIWELINQLREEELSSSTTADKKRGRSASKRQKKSS